MIYCEGTLPPLIGVFVPQLAVLHILGDPGHTGGAPSVGGIVPRPDTTAEGDGHLAGVVGECADWSCNAQLIW